MASAGGALTSDGISGMVGWALAVRVIAKLTTDGQMTRRDWARKRMSEDSSAF
jgi:hypothetical protein